MRKLTTSLATLLFLAASTTLTFSQSLTNYSFNAVAGTYNNITGTALTLSGGDLDEGRYNNIPIGFTFWYMGQPYTQIHASTNGFACLGAPLTISLISNNLATGSAANRPFLAPLWDDLEVDASGSVRYETVGTPGNRIFTLQWDKIQWDFGAAGPVISFQLKLYESNYQIEFIYNQEANAVNSGSASIGISAVGTGAGNYLSLSDASSSPTASSTTETTTINAKPANGQIYRFTPTSSTAAPINLSFTSVFATAMTLNWEDNSTNEVSFWIFRSTDAVNYIPVGSVTSSTTATTGTTYNFNATGLSPSTLYYWQVYAVSEIPSSPLSGNQSTTPGVLCGTYTVGPTGTYTSLTSAFADLALNSLNCPVIFELQAAYNSSVETFPLNVPYFFGSSTNTVTVRPETGATGLSITSNDPVATLSMNGTSWIIFDGRPGGTGTNRELSIINTNTTGSAVEYINNSQNTTLDYVKVRGVNTSTTNGVIAFRNALTSGGGNSFNTISNSEIFDETTTPTNLIYSNNSTAGTFNENNIITNNLIYNQFNPNSATNAIWLDNGNNAWTISNNSFYQTNSRTYTTANTHSIIKVSNTGGNYTISNNFLGGSAPNCGGTPYTMAGTIATRFIGINFAGTGNITSNINNNTIQNFSLNTSSGASTSNGIWCGINLSGSNTTANVTNNIIGSTTSTGNISTLTTTSGGLTVGIHCQATGTVNISNNSIGGISAQGSTLFTSTSITGINISTSIGTGLRTISGNTIGSSTLPNSLATSLSTGFAAGNLVGINVLIGGNYVITNNTITGLANLYAGSSTSSITRGINVTSGTNTTITGNTIAALSTSAPSAGTGTSASLAGIMMSSTTAGNHIISNNTIGGLLNTNPGNFATVSAGIIYSGPTTGVPASIFKNNIGFIGSNSTSSSAVNFGILSNSGLARIFNNFINLGLNPDGTSRTGSQIYEGIRKAGTQSNSFFFNTVAIQGSGVTAGAANTYAFNRTTSGVDTLINNIFVNNRSNGTSTGTHYSIQLNNNTTLTSNKNDFYGNGTGYVLGRSNLVDYATLAAWQGGVGQDALSISADPNFVSTLDLHINNSMASQLESTGLLITGINNDIDNDTRPGPTGSVNGGAINPDIGADEFDGTPVPNGQLDLSTILLVTPTDSSCYTANQTVTFRIKNNGLSTFDFSVNNATFTSNVTGPNPFTFPPITINSGTLAPGATQDITVSTTYDMSVSGNYTFSGTVTVAGDVIASNDTLISLIEGLGTTTVTASPDVSICLGDSSTIMANGVPALISQTFSNTTAIPIPDNDSIFSSIVLPSSFSSINAADIISVNLTITHTFNADLDIFLIAPDGSQIELSTDNGGSGDNYSNVTFITSAPASITSAPTTGITGNWQPEFPFSSLTGTADGTWQLLVIDDFAGISGTLQNWSITILGPQNLTYSWSPATGLNDPNIANPVASPTSTTTYVVTVTDQRGCTATDSIVVTVNPLPSITTTTVQPSCVPGNDGQIDVTVTGNSPFTYLWNDLVTTEDRTGLGFGTYTVTVTDANGCSDTNSITFAISGFTLTGVVTDVTCNGGNNGQIDVTATGGTPPYQGYSWNDGNTNEDRTGITAGNYTVTLTDNAGCTTTASFTVNEPTAISILSTITDVDCYGNSTGQIDITVSGGVGSYTYQWIDTATSNVISTNEDLSGVNAGTYKIIVTDGNSCTMADTLTINQPSQIQASSINSNVSCNGFADGSIDLTVTGGSSPYLYSWNNSQTTEDISGLSAGNYTVSITDNNGCTLTYSTTITEPSALTHTILSSDVLCFGDSTGTGIVTPSGGTAPYSYLWSDGQTDSIAHFPIGTYTVTITDANGCTNTNSVVINQPLMLTVNIINSTNVTCKGLNNGTATVVAGYGTPGYTYVWSNGNTTTTATNLGPGTYTVTVTDGNGCTGSTSVSITEPSAITATGNITDEVWGNDGAIDITPSGGTPPYTYNWSNSQTTEDINNLAGGTYTVTITDDNGCTQSFTYTVISHVGIEDETTGLGTINFYPNPSNGQLNMSVTGFSGEMLQVDVLDINGKVVFNTQIKNAPENFIQELDLRSLTIGTYFIRITSDKGVHNSRIIIARN